MTDDQDRVTEQGLAEAAGLTVEFVRQLVAARIISPDADGRFPSRYARRVRLYHGVHESGVGLDAIRALLESRIANPDTGDRFIPQPAPRSRRTFAEFRASLGARAEVFDQVYSILGFPSPQPDDHLGIHDEAAMTSFLAAWGDDPVLAVRAARLAADSMWRVVNGWARLVNESILEPFLRAGGDSTDPPPGLIQQARAAVDSGVGVIDWLTQRYIERSNVGLNIDNIEGILRSRSPAGGAGSGLPEAERAVMFADVAGFTTVTHDMGDERAAVIALKLWEYAERAARENGGRLVKLLGDGAILMFRKPAAAFDAARLLARSWPVDLPGLHTGIGVGPVLEIDGDVYGSTVNLAARLSQAARPGQTLVASLTGPDALPNDGLIPAGPLTLKGIPIPVPAMELDTARES